jgi:hypothetical protein
VELVALWIDEYDSAPYALSVLGPIKEHGSVLQVLTRVNSTNILDEGLRIGEIVRQMNSKVKSVKQGVYRK